MPGFKVVWTNLAALRCNLEHCEATEDESAVSWPVVGRFKAELGVAGCHMIPIAGTTDSGIRVFAWVQRFLLILARAGHEEGWAFRRPDGTR